MALAWQMNECAERRVYPASFWQQSKDAFFWRQSKDALVNWVARPSRVPVWEVVCSALMLPWRRRCWCGYWELSSLPSVSVWPPRSPESRRPLISDRDVPETWDGPSDCLWHCLWNFPWHQQPAFVVKLQKLWVGLQLTLRLTFSNLNQWKLKHCSPHKSFAFAAFRPLPPCHSTVIWSLVWGGVVVPQSWMTHFFVTLNYPCFYNSSQRPGESGL